MKTLPLLLVFAFLLAAQSPAPTASPSSDAAVFQKQLEDQKKQLTEKDAHIAWLQAALKAVQTKFNALNTYFQADEVLLTLGPEPKEETAPKKTP